MMGVDGLGSGGEITGGRQRQRRVGIILGVWRGSFFLIPVPSIVIGGTMCLKVQ